MFCNRDSFSLPIDEKVTDALISLGFEIMNSDITNERLKLVMWHGSIPERSKELQFNYPVICLKMSSKGLIGKCPKIAYQRIKDVFEPNYYMQGCDKSTQMPNTKEEWINLFSWLLEIEEKEWGKNDDAPRPDDKNILKFIFTEPPPETLIAVYLMLLACKMNPKIAESCTESKPDFWKQSSDELPGINGMPISWNSFISLEPNLKQELTESLNKLINSRLGQFKLSSISAESALR